MQGCVKGDGGHVGLHERSWLEMVQSGWNAEARSGGRDGSIVEEDSWGNSQSLKAICISSLFKCLFHGDAYHHFPVLQRFESVL